MDRPSAAGPDESRHRRLAGAPRDADTHAVHCLVAFTATGGTALRLARERPLQPVVVLTPDINVARRLSLTWGLETRLAALTGQRR